jgi:three-Cys-motif partner protein
MAGPLAVLTRAMAERPWGFWTESKLDMLSAYLPAFTTASKKARPTVYLDLFAGQDMNISRDTGRPIDGSLRRALEAVPSFAVVRGFELQRNRAQSLQDAYRLAFPHRDVLVHAGDVHDTLGPALRDLATYRWSPTFAFVDPDGVEARWELLEALAAHKAPRQTKVELFLLLASPQIVRVVNDHLDDADLKHAEQQVTDLFGCTDWHPILRGRRSGALDAAQTRDELTNLMRWRLEQTLGYLHTHTLRLTNVRGVPLYDMVFATDHPIGDKIMRSVYRTAAARFPRMRQEARARRRDRQERDAGGALFTHEELMPDAALAANETYEHTPPTRPYGQES